MKVTMLNEGDVGHLGTNKESTCREGRSKFLHVLMTVYFYLLPQDTTTEKLERLNLEFRDTHLYIRLL